MGSEIVFLFSFPSHFLYFAMLFLLKQNKKAQKIEQEKEKKEKPVQTVCCNEWKTLFSLNERLCCMNLN